MPRVQNKFYTQNRNAQIVELTRTLQIVHTLGTKILSYVRDFNSVELGREYKIFKEILKY